MVFSSITWILMALTVFFLSDESSYKAVRCFLLIERAKKTQRCSLSVPPSEYERQRWKKKRAKSFVYRCFHFLAFVEQVWRRNLRLFTWLIVKRSSLYDSAQLVRVVGATILGKYGVPGRGVWATKHAIWSGDLTVSACNDGKLGWLSAELTHFRQQQ